MRPDAAAPQHVVRCGPSPHPRRCPHRPMPGMLRRRHCQVDHRRRQVLGDRLLLWRKGGVPEKPVDAPARKRNHRRQNVGFDIPARRIVSARPQAESSLRIMPLRPCVLLKASRAAELCSKSSRSPSQGSISCPVDFLIIDPSSPVVGRTADLWRMRRHMSLSPAASGGIFRVAQGLKWAVCAVPGRGPVQIAVLGTWRQACLARLDHSQ